MITIEIWEPSCENPEEPCSRRATRIVRDGEKEVGKFCSTHGDRVAKERARKGGVKKGKKSELIPESK
jgi:hypothetical protein